VLETWWKLVEISESELVQSITSLDV
jgi:hypothetical protein